MKKKRNIIAVGSFILTLVMALYVSAWFLLLPGTAGGTHHLLALSVLLLPLPLLTAFVIQKAITCSTESTPVVSVPRDPLTNLYNQTVFWDFLVYETERAKRQEYRFSLLIADLDDFKALNERYGHDQGDEILVDFADILKDAIRMGDIAVRYSGDTFIVILPLCDEAQAYAVAQRLLESLRGYSHTLPNKNVVRITASIGISVFPEHAQDAQELYLQADTMLARAKSAGKGALSISAEARSRDLMKGAGQKSIFIMEAIRKRQIIPYFQPILCMKDRSILAYEVLTRIVTPEKVFAAAEFIEHAEGMGAIGKIDCLLMEQTFDAVRRNGFPGQLFINLSPKALILGDFLPTVRTLMTNYGITPSQIVFEITERETVKNLALLERSVRSLKQEGFRFAIDDFGSGYSSFLYLKMFQVDYLKIDGEFIRNMTSDSGTEHAIVSNIAGLAEALGITTIAEYVESQQIFDKVIGVGIDCGQGYFIQRPAPEMLSSNTWFRTEHGSTGRPVA